MSHTVLVVDDSLTVRMDLSDKLRAAGFDVIACSTVAEARQIVAQGVAGAYILDVRLPDGDGVDLLHEIRSAPSGLAAVVVMLSTEAEVKDRIRGLRTGADEYVGKPYDASYLMSRVQELLQARHDPGKTTSTVLVIDDSETYRQALRAALEESGHHVIGAPTGEEGLRLAAARRPDAIIVDSVLPGIDGATVIRHVRLDASLRNVPCLMLTGLEDRRTELQALDAGADTFVRKGLNLEIVLAKVGAALRRSQGRTAVDDDTRSLLGAKKILAVDRSATYLQSLSDALAGEGYDIVLARSGAEAIDLLAVQPVDCILLDESLPDGNAYDLCRRIKSAPGFGDVPLIMLGALAERDAGEAAIEALGAGADDYVRKLGDDDALRARIRAQVRRRRFEDERRLIREQVIRREHEAAEARAARELAETRAALVTELERTNQELEAFSYSVSHDLRAPLRSVSAFSEMLVNDYGSTMPAAQREMLDHVYAGARRMEQLIEDLLKLSRMGRQSLTRDPVDVSAIVQEIVAELIQQHPERLVDVRLASLPAAVGDAALLKQVLINLLSNAFKFTRHRASALIEVTGRAGDTENEYVVRDNGAGFDPAYADRLFGVFQRLHGEHEFEGTGVGLSIVQRIVQRHGGRVWAEAAVDRGATFHFTLPR